MCSKHALPRSTRACTDECHQNNQVQPIANQIWTMHDNGIAEHSATTTECTECGH